jgi:hypothetical protein
MKKRKILVRDIKWDCAPRGHEEKNIGLPSSAELVVDDDDFDSPLELNEFAQECLSNRYGVIVDDFKLEEST